MASMERGHEGLRALWEYKVRGGAPAHPQMPLITLHQIKIFASLHPLIPSSKFWYFVSQLKKMNSSGKLVPVGRCSRNFVRWEELLSIWLHHSPCSGTHMYQVYWDLTTTGNVTFKCHQLTGVQHSIQIIMVGGDHSQKVPSAKGQEVLQLSKIKLLPLLGPTSPESAMLHHQ